jgi:recombination protein RecA
LIPAQAGTILAAKANKKRMTHAARAHLESLLRTRKLDVTLPSAAPWAMPVDTAPTGLAAIDGLLGGGLRRGHLSEIVGPPSSGRTTVMCRAMAEAANRGEAVALVDTSDRFDPLSAAEAGLDLSKLLWVRPSTGSLTHSASSGRSDDAARALKAMNLILQAGKFGLVVFDIADVPLPGIRQFPATTWMRISRVIEGTQTVALLCGSERIARSPGGVTIALDPPGVKWTGSGARGRLLRGMDVRPRIVGAR